MRLSPPCSRQVRSITAGIARVLTRWEGPPEAEPIGGGDMNGSRAHHLHGQSGTNGSRLGVARALGFQSSNSQMLPDYVPEAPPTGAIYARNGLLQAWETLAGTPYSVPVIGTGWAANQFLNWRLLDGGASVQVMGNVSRNSNAPIPPGTPNNIVLCTLPVQPVASSMQIVPALAQTVLGYQPEQLIEYGYLLFSLNGSLTFYGHAPNAGFVQGTASIYVSNTFPLTMPGVAELILPEPAEEPPRQPGKWRAFLTGLFT